MAGSSINQYIVRHQLLAKAAAVGAAGLLLIIVGVIPLVSRIGKNTDKIRVREKEEKALVDKVTLLTQLDANVLAERMKVLDLALPPRKDVVAYLAAIDGLARELGLSFGGLSLSPGEVSGQSTTASAPSGNKRSNANGLQTLDTTIKMKGNEEGIYTFLRNVEQTLPLMQIKDVKVSVIGVDQYSLSLSIGMLWAPAVASDVKGAVALFNDQEEEYFASLSGYRSYRSELDATAVPSYGDGSRVDLFNP